MRGARDYWVIYYLVYVVSVIVLLALNWRNFTVENYVYLLAALAGASLGIALFIAILSEGIGYMVLLIPRRIEQLKDLGRKEGRREGQKEGRKEGQKEGRKEGRREERREWIAWNERRMSAEREGRPFNEPPPGDVGEDSYE